MKNFLLGVVIFVVTIAGLAGVNGLPSHSLPPFHPNPQALQPQGQPSQGQPPPIPPASQPRKPAITEAKPGYQAYPQIVEQIKKWNQEAPDLTEIGTYGKSSKGQDLYFLRVTNKLATAPKKKVLITGCIHGNEPLSTSTTMWFIGRMLSTYGTGYGRDPEATDLVNTRDIYFVPVVSPDSYPNSRHVDGVDPNRDFPGPYNWNHRSVPPVKAIGDFVIQQRFNAAISGHTFGRIYLTPYGDKMERCPNDADYQRIVGKMGQLSGYRVDRACNMYGRPIQGSDVDFYYRHGAFSIVMEYGLTQKIPSQAEISTEFNKTYPAVLHFIREAPLVQIQRER